MARLGDITVDCAHPASVARFWAALLDDYDVAPYDDEELARLKANGIDDPEDDPSVFVIPKNGQGPRLCFQLVPEPKPGKNRVHLDLRCDDLDAERARLVDLGAQVIGTYDGWVTFADPEGNELCVFT